MALTETTDWDALRMMRLHGHKPSLAVIVTSNPVLPARLHGVGCLVILHKAGESMPVQLLEGLDVILMLDTCELASRVYQFAKDKHVSFGRCRAWCKCAGELNSVTYFCKSYEAMVDWAEGKSDAA